MTGLTAGFYSLKCIKSLLNRESSPITKEWRWLSQPFWEQACPNFPQCWENQYSHFPTCLDLLKCRRKKKNQIKALNADRAEQTKHFQKLHRQPIPQCPTPLIPRRPFFPQGFRGWKRTHISFLVQPTSWPMAQLLGTGRWGTAGSSGHSSTLDKLCKLHQQRHSQPLEGGLSGLSSLPPCPVSKPQAWGIFAPREERTRLSGSPRTQCSRL